MDLVGKPQTLRVLNREAVEALLRACGPMTKAELSRRTRLSLVTVGKTVDELLAEGRIVSPGMGEPTGGRTARLYAFNRRQFCVMALSYEEGRFASALADAAGEIFYRVDLPVSGVDIVEEILDCVRELTGKAEGIPVARIGLGVPGVVSGGVVSQIPALPELEGVDLAAVLESTLGCPVLLEHDLNLAAWGLYLDRFSQETDHMACLYLGRGVGCGLVLGGRLFKGSSDFAGEVGSLCMKKGTLEEAFFQIRQQLLEGSGDRAALRRQLAELAAAAVNAIACVLDPGLVAVKCQWLGEEDLPTLTGGIAGAHRPRLLLVEDVGEACLRGLLDLCSHFALPSGER